MILWKDFILDDFLGFHLCCDKPLDGSSIRNDAQIIQETRQVQRPARMVSPPSLESIKTIGMEAERASSRLSQYRRER